MTVVFHLLGQLRQQGLRGGAEDIAATFKNNGRFHVHFNPVFIAAHLQSESTRREMLGRAKRAINQASINQQDVMSLTVMLPPPDLQRRFVEQVLATESIEVKAQSAARHVESLFHVLLRRAFAGELTAHWREAHVKELLEEMGQQAIALREFR